MRFHAAHPRQPDALHRHKVRAAAVALQRGHRGEGAAGALARSCLSRVPCREHFKPGVTCSCMPSGPA